METSELTFGCVDSAISAKINYWFKFRYAAYVYVIPTYVLLSLVYTL